MGARRKKTPPRGRALVFKKERDRAVAVAELVARDELDGAAPGVLRGAERQPGTADRCQVPGAAVLGSAEGVRAARIQAN